MKRVLLLLGLLALSTPAVPAQSPKAARAGAPLDLETFRYSRDILVREPGLIAVTLDAAALAHSSLGDLRIADARGLQIPFLREPAPEPLLLPLPGPERVEERAGRGITRYRVTMPYPDLPAARLVVETPADVFERYVFLEVQRPRRRGSRWPTPGEPWRDADPGGKAPSLELDVPADPGGTVDLLVDEGDNPRLPLGAVRLRLETWTLRFFHPGGSGVRLLYGRDDLAPPRYDLSLLAGQLDPTQAREAELGPESTSEPAAVPVQMPRGILWGSLIAAVAVLLGVLARLVREGETSGGSGAG